MPSDNTGAKGRYRSEKDFSHYSSLENIALHPRVTAKKVNALAGGAGPACLADQFAFRDAWFGGLISTPEVQRADSVDRTNVACEFSLAFDNLEPIHARQLVERSLLLPMVRLRAFPGRYERCGDSARRHSLRTDVGSPLTAR